MASGGSKKKKRQSGSSNGSKNKLRKRPRRNKFGAVRVGTFGSRTEALRFGHLQKMEKAGLISDLEKHPTYTITPQGWPLIKFIPDAQYLDTTGQITGVPGKLLIEDTKGMVTDVFKLKVKLFHGLYPSIGIFMVKSQSRKGSIANWVVTDIIPVKNRDHKVIIQEHLGAN